jgi:hypothetical protein
MNAACIQRTSMKNEEQKRSSPSWEEIGDEFRQAVFDFFHRIRDELNRK